MITGQHLTKYAVVVASLCLAGCSHHPTRHNADPTSAHCIAQAGAPFGSEPENLTAEQFDTWLRCMLALGALDRPAPVATPLPPEVARALREFCRGAGLPDDCGESQGEEPE